MWLFVFNNSSIVTKTIFVSIDLSFVVGPAIPTEEKTRTPFIVPKAAVRSPVIVADAVVRSPESVENAAKIVPAKKYLRCLSSQCDSVCLHFHLLECCWLAFRE